MLVAGFFDQGFFRGLLMLGIAFCWGFALYDLVRRPMKGWHKAIWFVVIALVACGASARQKTIATTLAATNAAADAFVAYDQDHRTSIVTHATSHENGVALLSEWDGTVDTVNTAFTTVYKAIATAATVNDDPSLAGMLQAWTIVQKQLAALGVKL